MTKDIPMSCTSEGKHIIKLKKIAGKKNTASKGCHSHSQTDLEKLGRPLVRPLTNLIYDSLDLEIFQESWKHARVAPVLKSGKPKVNRGVGGKPSREPNSHCPISMKVTMSKFFQQCVKFQLQEHVIKHGFIPQSQHSYEPEKSTETAVAHAFDLIDSYLLRKKLERLSCSHMVKKWIGSYLEGRKNCTEK